MVTYTTDTFKECNQTTNKRITQTQSTTITTKTPTTKNPGGTNDNDEQ